MSDHDITSDHDLVRDAREERGASDVGAVPDDDIYAELELVKELVTREVRVAMEGGTIDLFADEAPREMARNLLYLRVENLKRGYPPGVSRAENRSKGRLPPIPLAIGRLRRYNFTDSDLLYYRNELVRHSNRLTSDGN